MGLGFRFLVLSYTLMAQALGSASSEGGLLSEVIVDYAIAAPLTKHSRSIAGGAHTNRPDDGGAPFVLALASHLGSKSADGRLIEQVRCSLTPGNEITANGGYPAQHERIVVGMLAIVKNTPRIWSRLSPAEKVKAELTVRASLFSSAFTTSDENPFIVNGGSQFALDGDGNLNRGWNPNYREGMTGGLFSAMYFYGSADLVDSILKRYDHESFVSELKAAGLRNILQTFNWKAKNPSSKAPSGSQIEHAVRNYSLKGRGIDEYEGIYKYLVEDTFGKLVQCGLEGGIGIDGGGRIISGCESIPNLGKKGMLKEFDSYDANGKRSSIKYCYHGFRPHQINLIMLNLGGFVTPEKLETMGISEFIFVGANDLWYKFQNGYKDYHKGRPRGVYSAKDGDLFGLPLTIGLWREFTQPYCLGVSSN